MHMCSLSAHAQLFKDIYGTLSGASLCCFVKARANRHSPRTYTLVLYSWLIRGRALVWCLQWMNKQHDEWGCLTDGVRTTFMSMHRFAHMLKPRWSWETPPPPKPQWSVSNQLQQSCKYGLHHLYSFHHRWNQNNSLLPPQVKKENNIHRVNHPVAITVLTARASWLC